MVLNSVVRFSWTLEGIGKIVYSLIGFVQLGKGWIGDDRLG